MSLSILASPGGLHGRYVDYVDFLFSVLLIIFEMADVDTPS